MIHHPVDKIPCAAYMLHAAQACLTLSQYDLELLLLSACMLLYCFKAYKLQWCAAVSSKTSDACAMISGEDLWWLHALGV